MTISEIAGLVIAEVAADAATDELTVRVEDEALERRLARYVG